MNDRATPQLSRAQAFKIADDIARTIIWKFDIHEIPDNCEIDTLGDLATTEDLRAFLYAHLAERFAAPAPTTLPDHLQDVASAMMFTGGSFVQSLGTALIRADLSNRARIVAAFPELIERYSKIATEGK